MKRILASIVVLACLLPVDSNASTGNPTWTPGNPPVGWQAMPFQAPTWFDRSRDGAGWAIERYPPLTGQTQPLYSGIVYIYDAQRNPYWLLMAGTYQPPSYQQIIRDGSMGSFSGVLNDGVGGACPTCNYIVPDVGPSPYASGVIAFDTGAEARVSYNGVPMEHIEPSRQILFQDFSPEWFLGDWRHEVYFGSNGVLTNGTPGNINVDDLKIEQIPPPSWAGNIQRLNADTYRIPAPQTTVWMKATNTDLGGNAFIYFLFDTVEKKLRRIGTFTAIPINGSVAGIPTVIGYQWSPDEIFYELIPINDDTIIGIPYRNSVNYVNNTAATQSYNLVLRMTRKR
ncbi:MAG: hypothetical protein R3F04_06920 [Lysobacteraceae bacterium]